MTRNFMNRLFTDSVKAAQTEYGTRESQARHEGGELIHDELTLAEAQFIASRDGFYMATVNEDGWPYLQFRGGPEGFLKVIDAGTIGYADFRGNRQLISMGNLRKSGKTALFLMDYPSQSRLKLMVESEVINAADRPDLLPLFQDPEYMAPIERFVVLKVVAYDWNCPKHITPRFTEDEWRLVQDGSLDSGRG
ncbi:MAG: putative pyridoxine 5'-phosphate oxidase superfamily flavin-nucleotide-binding protein [Planctomycetota bacterium]|jgi:predicted pyridoxine 5'-phosphate oxidase superfamily flavin-nucleotide-binding protein